MLAIKQLCDALHDSLLPICLQLGGVIEPNREQCYLNSKGEYVESANEVRLFCMSLSSLLIIMAKLCLQPSENTKSLKLPAD